MPGNSLPSILIADDDDDARLILRRALVKAGVKNPVATFSDGEELIQFLDTVDGDAATAPPILLLLDVNMPRLTGFDVLAALQRRGGPPGLRTVIVSSSAREEDMARAAALGAEGYLVKFPAPEVLATVVRQFARPAAVEVRCVGGLVAAG